MSMKTNFALLYGDLDRLDCNMTDDQVTNAALEAGARPIEEQMLSNAITDPQIDTGTLFKSIVTGRIKSAGGTRKKIDVGVHSNASAFYAAWVEFGHGGPQPAPPHPYVVPAYDAREEEAYDNIKTVLANALKLRN